MREKITVNPGIGMGAGGLLVIGKGLIRGGG